MKFDLKSFLDKKKNIKISWRRIGIALAFFVVLISVLLFGLISYAQGYKDRVSPGVHVGSISIGGMDRAELNRFLETMKDKLFKDGIHISYSVLDQEKSFVIDPLDQENLLNAELDTELAADQIINYGKHGSTLVRSISTVFSRVRQPEINLSSVSLNRSRLLELIDQGINGHEVKAKNAELIIDSVEPLKYTITDSHPGIAFEYSDAAGQVLSSWSKLSVPDIKVATNIDQPLIATKDLDSIEEKLEMIFEVGPHFIHYQYPDSKKEQVWKISKQKIAEFLVPQISVNNLVILGLAPSSTIEFIEYEIADLVETESRDAIFELNSEGKKVVDFQSSLYGVGIDREQTYADINSAIWSRFLTEMEISTSTDLTVQVVDPDLKLEDANDLGIKEKLGSGFSNFSGSPRNRILNIKNAVYNKLHGTLVPPEEEFSLVNSLRPFTLEAGYLPELVIVGDRIKPEVAGGLCQVGTTIFRATMNSGMPITQRVNHGLVVGYYNDPSNGNPGTDATIYDGWPDFRFKNDTGSHILITVSMNVSTGHLEFAMWGTSDGRKGSYTPPKVSKWIPVGEYKEIITDDLEPGEKECQSAHPGAVASFTYIRELANGEKEERVFNSRYRAVPKTCYIGREEEKECQEDDEECVVDEIAEEEDENNENSDSPLNPEQIG